MSDYDTVPTVPAPMPWRIHANCAGCDPDLFFPERGAPTREAQAVCRGCVVRLDCLEHALTYPEVFGIWGGMSQKQLKGMRRRRRLEAHSA